MYEDLVNRLRYCSEEHSGCGTCELSDNCVLRAGLLLQAADAIEELILTAESYRRSMKAWADVAANAQPRWIPVTERLPEDRQSVLVHRDDGGIFIFEYFTTSPTDECWIDDHLNVYSAYCVTHWMPLPEGPEEE